MAPNLHLRLLWYASVTLMPFFRSHAQMKQLPASACTSFSSASAWGDSGTEATCRRRLRSANRNIRYVKNSGVCTCKYARKGCHSTIEERQFQRSSKHVWVSDPAQLLGQDCNQPVRRKTRSHVFQGFQCCSSNCITCCASQTLSRDVPSILCTHRGHKMTPQDLPVSQWFTSQFYKYLLYSKSILLPVPIPHGVRVTCQCLFSCSLRMFGAFDRMKCIEMQDLSRSRTTYTGPDSEILNRTMQPKLTQCLWIGAKSSSQITQNSCKKDHQSIKKLCPDSSAGLLGLRPDGCALPPMLNQDTRWYIPHHSTYFKRVCFKASAE